MPKLAQRVFRKLGYSFQDVRTPAGALEEFHIRKDRNRVQRTDVSIVDHQIHGKPYRFAVNFRHDHIQRHHFNGEFYEQDELDIIAQEFNGGVFVDIGANVGNHALYVLKELNAKRVIAFEPGHLAATLFTMNMALNGVIERVELHTIGLSDKNGSGSHDNWAPYNLGGARMNTDGGDIEIRTGDEVLAGKPVDFIKIDTEGMELAVLRGLKGTIAREKPLLFVEVEDDQRVEFDDYLAEVGYAVRKDFRRYDTMTNVIAGPSDKTA